MNKEKECHLGKEKVQHKQHDGSCCATDNHETTKEGQKDNLNS